MFGEGSFASLPTLMDNRRKSSGDYCVIYVDHFFSDGKLDSVIRQNANDVVIYIDTTDEPKTSGIDTLVAQLSSLGKNSPCAVVGIGGGATLDTAKAVSNLLTNGGYASQYQGWDLVPNPGVYKIGVPTLSGTGAESSRTCVMTNPANGLKLGMNSDHTIYDQLVMDPELTATVPRNQYAYTGMDTYIHCIESLAGRYRNAVGDAFSRQALELAKNVFDSDDMMSAENRGHIMVASYLGGVAIANSFVGVVHPFSAGLSVVLGLHHCVANCITMYAMEEFYPQEHQEFCRMMERQGVSVPAGVCSNLSDEQYRQLYASTIIHEKPLSNALGDSFRDILTEEKVISIFKRM